MADTPSENSEPDEAARQADPPPSRAVDQDQQKNFDDYCAYITELATPEALDEAIAEERYIQSVAERQRDSPNGHDLDSIEGAHQIANSTEAIVRATARRDALIRTRDRDATVVPPLERGGTEIPLGADAGQAAQHAAFLADVEERIAQAGGPENYYWTAPAQDLQALSEQADRMLKAGSPLLHGPNGVPVFDLRDPAAAVSVAAHGELAARQELAQPPDLSLLEYKDSPAMPRDLDRRQEYLDRRLQALTNSTTLGRDEHIQLLANTAAHLTHFQLLANDLGQEPFPSELGQFSFGERVVQAWTTNMAESPHEPEAVAQLTDHIREMSDYGKHAIDMYRTAQDDDRLQLDVIPPGIDPDDWDTASQKVQTAIDMAAGYGDSFDAAIDELLSSGQARPLDTPQAEQATATFTPKRDEYLQSRHKIAEIGAALADPTMQLGLRLHGLQGQHATTAAHLQHAQTHRPGILNRAARRRWKERTADLQHQLTSLSTQIDTHQTTLGPDHSDIVNTAVTSRDDRDRRLDNITSLHNDAVLEDLRRQPEWLTNLLGPTAHVGQVLEDSAALAYQLSSHRLLHEIVDDHVLGLSPHDTGLLAKVQAFKASIDPTITPDIGPDLEPGF